MTIEQIELMGGIIALIGFWSRLEHRLTLLESILKQHGEEIERLRRDK